MCLQIGIKAPSSYEGKLTKSMFLKKDVQLKYAQWDTASYSCPHCGHFVGRLGDNYVTKLEDENKELKDRTTELEKRMTVTNWYKKDDND